MDLSPVVPQNGVSAVYNINHESDLLFGLQWILKNHLSQDTDVEKLFCKYQFAESDHNALSTVIKLAVHKESNSSSTGATQDRMKVFEQNFL
jgi:hypothetical protein